MDFLGLLGAGDLSSTNSPDRLVGNDDLGPILNLLLDSSQLRCNDVDSLVALALFQALAAAEDNANTTIESSLGLGGNELVVLL